MAAFQGKIIFGKRRVLNMVFTALFIYATLLLFLFFNQRHLIYYPNSTLRTPAEAGVPEMQVVGVQPAGLNQAIQGWYIPPSNPALPVILYFHGNAGGIDIRASRAKAFMAEGYGVLLAEYRGYSGNPGSPSEKAFFADAEAYYAWLLGQGISENNIVIYGESIGTGTATYLASQHNNARALVLEAPFSSLTDVVQSRMLIVPVGLLLKDRYSSISRIGHINMPLLVLHGDHDNVVAKRFGEKLFNAASEPKTLKSFPEGGHSDLYDFGAGQAVIDFLKADVERRAE